MGARSETLLGLSGLGDLVLTCGSPQSRNMSLGRSLGEGQKLGDILGGRTAVTEGVYTAAAVVRLARDKGVEMPIAEAVYAIIEDRATVDDAISGLMLRPLKAED
jgi:glycerol-3-phosphate dehydrogenase (NAD(P)+)